MKAFISSLITVFLLAATVTVNGIYIVSRMDSLINTAYKFPDSTGDTETFDTVFEEFDDRWTKCRSVVALSVSHAEAELVDEALHLLHTRFTSGEEAEYAAAKTVLLDELRELRETEALSKTIF